MKEEEILEIHIRDVYNYLFSYGGQSRFFRELSENRRFMGTRCLKCNFVWCPPRTTCSICLSPTEWIELGNEGEIIASLTLTNRPTRLKHLKSPLVAALIKLDGSNTCLKTIVAYKEGEHESVQRGKRVKAELKRKKIESIADFYFRPA